MRSIIKLIALLLLSSLVSGTFRLSNINNLNSISRRDATTTPECGKGATPGNETCPLNVCCSEYGNCGITADFCGKGCQSGCDALQRPTCEASTNNSTSSSNRTIGYYESWALNRKCQSVSPEQLNLTGFTHINYAFMLFDPATFAIASADNNGTSLLTRFTDLKTNNTGLQTWVAIGGWNFNEPGPTATAFSNMAASPENRTKFAREITSFMESYAFDGLDIDWEYPSASDRGGSPADKANLVSLTADLRQAFGSRYGLSVTLPASYYYMRNFDVTGMQSHVDFFNIMSYDLHGAWDKETKGLGPYVRPHTNLTEIDGALNLLWRAKVAPEKVNLGLAWYGRAFTLKDSKCAVPDGVCQFERAGLPGPCSGAAGTLDLYEIQDVISAGSLTPTLDKTAGVKYVAFNQTQWVGYDDDETIAMKRGFAGSRCLGGTMVWAMDQANQESACGLPAALRPSGSNETDGLTGEGNGTAPCAGQTIAAPSKRVLSRWSQSLRPRADNATCEALSKQYGVATGTLQALTHDPTCQVSGAVCVPAACNLTPVAASDTCESIVAAAGNITSAQLKAWNPSILGSWEALAPGQFVCTSPPGGWYALAAAALAPSPGGGESASASASSLSATLPATLPVTGASSATSVAPTSASAPASQPASTGSSIPTEAPTEAPTSAPSGSLTAGADAPAKTQAGIAPDCNSFAIATAGDTCIGFAAVHGIEPAQLYAWNPVLGENGAACSTALWAEESYCIGTGSSGGASSAASSAATTSSAAATGSATALVPTQLLPNSTTSTLYSTDSSQTTDSISSTLAESTISSADSLSSSPSSPTANGGTVGVGAGIVTVTVSVTNEITVTACSGGSGASAGVSYDPKATSTAGGSWR